MKILITGGAGFIGKHLASKLLNQHKVIVLDRKKIILEGVKCIKGDIRDYKNFLKVGKVDIIYHFAAQTSSEISELNSIEDLSSNIMGTYNVYKYAIESKVKEVIFTSSMAVYGESKIAVREINTCNPKSFYGISKLTAEKILTKLKNKKIDTKIFRLFNVYGPGQDLKNLKQGMVSIFISQALKNKRIEIKGSLNRFRDFIYIDDVIKTILSKKIKNNKIYNVGFGKKIKVSNLIKIILKNLPFKVKTIIKDSTVGDVFGTYANIKPLISLNIKPKVSIEEGIKKTLKFLND